MGGGFPLRTMGSEPQAGLPSLQHQSQKGAQTTSSCEKQQGFCLPGRDGSSLGMPHKMSMHKTSFAVTYLRLQQREGRVDQRWLQESGVGSCGERTEGTATRTPGLSHTLHCGSISQAEHSFPSGISLRGSHSPTCSNYSAPPCGAYADYCLISLTTDQLNS